MTLYLKDPESTLDYAINWAAGYLDAQTITASSWSVVPVEAGGITITAQAHEPTATRVTVSGGLPGHVYRLANHITLSDGTSDDRALVLRVEQR